jgi:hypothetical protein
MGRRYYATEWYEAAEVEATASDLGAHEVITE